LDNIEGTWRFVRATARDGDGNLRDSHFNDQRMGRIVIGGGRIAVMMIDFRPNLPAGEKRDYGGYTGTYTFDGKQLVTTVDAAPHADRVGTKQPRGVRFEDGLMVLIPPPREVDGVMEHRELAWQKISEV
jgi:hypothetical protein